MDNDNCIYGICSSFLRLYVSCMDMTAELGHYLRMRYSTLYTVLALQLLLQSIF